MAGIGNYAKGKKFTLKSGNTPMFKHVGSSPSPITSPANMNNFGIGKGTSPLEQSYEIKRGDNLSKIAKANNTTVEALMAANPDIKDKNKIIAGQALNLSSDAKEDGAPTEDPTSTDNDASNIKDNLTREALPTEEGEPKVNKFKTLVKKGAGRLVQGFTHGLDAVYGTGTVEAGGNVVFNKPKEKDTETGEDKVNKLLK
jgi:LysM repeat protein